MTEGSRNTPKPVDFEPSRYPNLVADNVCGDCIFFSRHTHAKYSGPCKSLGVQTVSKPCKVFTPEPAKFKFRAEKDLRLFAKLVGRIGKDHLPLIASILLRERKTRAKGFHFGQPVFVRAFGGDYISNYAKAYISHVERGRAYLTAGLNKNSETVFTACVKLENVLTVSQWKKKKLALKAKGFVKDPDIKKYTTVIGLGKNNPLVDYVVPTIDSVLTDKSKKKKSKTVKTNFVEINHDDDTSDVFKARG